jgi:PKD repeat protein
MSAVSAADVVPLGEPPHLEADMDVNPIVIFEYGTGDPDKTTVTLTVMGKGEADQQSFDVDAMLVIDRSGSMCGGELADAKIAAKIFIDEMSNHDQSGLVSFESRAFLHQGLTFHHIKTKSVVDTLQCDGATAMGDGINMAQDEIELNGRHDAIHVMIVLSDGKSNTGAGPVEAAKDAKRAGTVIYAIGLGNGADEYTLKQVATDANHYYFAPDSGDLAEIYEKISEEVSNIAGADVVVNYDLPFAFEYIPYTFSIPGTITGNTARWNIGTISIDEVWSVTFEVRSNQCGYLPVNDVAHTYVIYTMPTGVIDSIDFPEWHVQVECPRLVDFTWSPQIPGEGRMVQFTDLSLTRGSDWIISWDWDFGDGSPHSALQNPMHAYADDGVYKVNLVVTYNDGDTGTFMTDIRITNSAPMVTLDVLPVEVGVDFRIAGEKWHDVVVNLYEDGVGIAERRLVRHPGSPNIQILHLMTLQADVSKEYRATVYYTPEDDPVNGQLNGANPCWMILDFGGEDVVWMHHTFNVQHPMTYVWTVELTNEFLSHGLSFEGSITDPGADSLSVHWEFGDGNVSDSIHPNIQGTFPVELTETASHWFAAPGTYTVVLIAEDDDGGIGMATVEVTVPE